MIKKESLSRKVMIGSFLYGITKVIQQSMSLILNLVLARLLLPDSFGLIALVMVVIGIITLFSILGFGASIIQKQSVTQEQLSTLYWINVILSVVVYAIIFFITPIAADFYNEPRIVDIVRLMGIGILISPFFVIHRKLMEKEFLFTKLARIDAVVVIIAGIFAIIAAYLGAGVYSFVVNSLSTTILYALLIYRPSYWAPLFVFNYYPVKDMVIYSIKYKGIVVAGYLERNIDYLIMGKIFSSITLGLYAFAYNIMFFPVKRIASIMIEILFPAFSSVQHDQKKLRNGYVQSTKFVALLVIPLMTYISINSSILIYYIFGAKWAEAIPIVSILCFAAIFQSLEQLVHPVFAAIDRLRFNLYLGLLRAFVTAIAIILGMQNGAEGVAAALVIARIISFTISNLTVWRILHFKLSYYMKVFFGPLLVTGSLLLTSYLVSLLDLQSVIGDFIKILVPLLASVVTLLLTNYKDVKRLMMLKRKGNSNI